MWIYSFEYVSICLGIKLWNICQGPFKLQPTICIKVASNYSSESVSGALKL